MKVHIVRHAQAVERSTNLPDEQRYITCRGRKKFRKVAASLKKMDIDPDIIFTSPKIRAVQTAEILSETIQFNGKIQISPELALGPDSESIAAIIRSVKSANEIVIIGHEPFLGETIGQLLKLSSPCYLDKGAVVTLKITVKQSGITAELSRLITCGGKPITKAVPALERLQGINHNVIKGASI